MLHACWPPAPPKHASACWDVSCPGYVIVNYNCKVHDYLFTRIRFHLQFVFEIKLILFQQFKIYFQNLIN